MSSDGISYLDLGDAWMRGDWKTAINAYWSPMYSVLLGAAVKILKPSGYWEFPVVHLVNFVIFLVSLVCFEFFWKEFLRSRPSERAGSGIQALPRWAWLTLGYVLFLWAGLAVVSVGRVNPDLLVAADVYLASGLVLRIRNGVAGWPSYGLLGIVLALGYFAKAPMFILAFVFLGVSLFALGHLSKAVPRVALALMVFLLFATPFVAVLSKEKGRLTFGDSGRWNYLTITTRYGKVVPRGKPLHPKPRVLDFPPVYTFGSLIDGTYPEWLDPTYWSDGVVPRFSVTTQMDVLKNNFGSYFNMLLSGQTSLLFGFFLLASLRPTGRRVLKDAAGEWPVLVPALAGLALYWPVYVEPRMVGPYFLLLWAGLFASVRLVDSQEIQRIARAVVLAIVVLLGLAVVAPGLLDLYKVFRPKPNRQWQVADGLHTMGLKPGDKIATIGESSTFHWARLGRFKIVAVIEPEDAISYWGTTPELKSRALHAFVAAGARMAVTDTLPPGRYEDGWQPIRNTGFSAYVLNKSP